jgi:saccharopine dehydrogenase (NAD+, L-lysine-forming)
MKFGIIKEGKRPIDERVALAPKHVFALMNGHADELNVVVQSSSIRRIQDQEYTELGVILVDTIDDCNLLIGVKEVPIADLIENKTYLFFSHTIKMQPYNKPLLQAVLDKNITLIDWECLRDARGVRLIGFGRYAGIVGTYNGFRALGYVAKSYDLKKAQQCVDRNELNTELNKVQLDPIKILLTGRGKVAKGSVEVLETLGVRKVGIREYLNENFLEPVYCQINFPEYNRRADGTVFKSVDFYNNPELFVSDFMRFAKQTDFYISGHYWEAGSPFLFTREDAKKEDFRIKLVADISCDIDGPVASTLRPSTIQDPFYGYDPINEVEVPFGTDNSIAVMAVDNLPCELPRDASNDFGEMFVKSILPSFLNGDKNGILKRATIATNGAVTDEYAYLREWVNTADE